MALFARPSGGWQTGKGLYKAPKLVRVTLDLPASILFITDLHLRRQHPEMADTVLSACSFLTPDLVLLGGDLAEYDEGLSVVLQKTAAAFPRAHIFAVPGNNDDHRLDRSREKQKHLYESYGINYLLNEARKFEIRNRKIEIVGLEDGYTHQPDPQCLFSGDADSYKILLAHEPLESSLDPNADLMLSGHTHGGQINVLGLTCYLMRYEAYFRFACLAGQKQIGKTHLLVSRGIGWSKYPIRFGARSEIHYIE